MNESPGSLAESFNRSDRIVALGVAVIAAAQLVTAAIIIFEPRWFFDHVGTFGSYNGHYLGDAGTMTLGAGLGLLASLKWPALRAGALATNLGIIGAHAVNHWLDIGHAHAGSSAGAVDAVALTVLAGATAFVLRRSLGRAQA